MASILRNHYLQCHSLNMIAVLPENRVQDLIVIMLDEGANLWEERLQRLWVLLLEDWAVHCPWYVGEPSVHLKSLSVSRATYCCNARSGP